MTQEHAMPKVEKDSYEQLRRQLRELEVYARNSAFPEGNPQSKGTDLALRSIANTLSQLAARLSGVAAVPQDWKLVPAWSSWPMRQAMRIAAPDVAGDILDHALKAALDAAPSPHAVAPARGYVPPHRVDCSAYEYVTTLPAAPEPTNA